MTAGSRHPLTVRQERAAMPLALALDIGSSSVRASLWDSRGRVVRGTAVRTTYAWRIAADGAVRLPAAALDRIVEDLLDALVSRCAPVLDRVVSAGLSSFFHSLVGLDAAGRPITDVISWADTTAADDARALADAVDAAAAWRRTGAPLHASYWPARIHRMSEKRAPTGGEPAERWTGYPELLLERLTGASAMGRSMASGTGLLDRTTGAWDPTLLAALSLDRARLPKVSDDLRPVGRLTGAARRRWPRLAHLRWFPAWGDGACGNVGLGSVGPGRAALMVGTSGAMRLLLDDPARRVSPGLFAYRFGPRHLLVGGQLSEGGGTLAWLAGLTGHSLAGLDRAAAGRPGPAALTVLPYLSGERGPGYHAAADGVIAGIIATTDAADLYRATVESIALRFGVIDRLLAETACAPDAPPAVIVSGGAATRSRLWPQALASVLGRAVEVAATAEASSRGAALLALHGEVALDPSGAIPPVPARRVEPDPDGLERYREAAVRQAHLYDRLLG